MTPEIIESILQALSAGILLGVLYGLMCVGLAVIFGVMRFVNFAQGDFMMLGMYIAYYMAVFFSTHALLGGGYDVYLAAILAGPVVFVVGYIIHRALISRVAGTRSAALDDDGHHAQLILTLGLSLILSNCSLILFGSDPHSIATPLSTRAWVIGPLWGELVSVFVNKSRGLAALVAVAVIVAVALFVKRTTLGKALRAAADNPEAAIYMGIDVDSLHRIAFAIGVGVTAIAGALLATNYPFQPYVGFDFIIVMFAGVVLGGLGSIMGAFWGGMTIGLVQQMSTLVLPIQLQNATIFIFFLLLIFLRPQGFFGRVTERT